MIKNKTQSGAYSARRRAIFHISGDLRKRKSHVFQPLKLSTTFINFVQTEILPELQLGNRILEKKHERIQQILGNVVLAYIAGGIVLADSRNTGGEAKTRIPMYDELTKMEILQKQNGSENSQKVARYAPTSLFAQKVIKLNFLDIVNPLLDEPITKQKPFQGKRQPTEFAPVILREKYDISDPKEAGHRWIKKSIPFPKMKDAELASIQGWEQIIMQLNEANLKNHSWVYTVLDKCGNPVGLNQPNPVVRAIFNNDFKHGGRLYSRGANGYQNISKAERRTMQIDGEGIAEVDFSGYHTRMLYHIMHIDFKGDVYQPKKLLPKFYKKHYSGELRNAGRKYIKTLTNIILNAETYKQAVAAAQKELFDNKLYKQAIVDTCQTSPKQLIGRTKQIHKPIARYFHTGIGLELQCTDAFLMRKVLYKFIKLDKPALSLHDAVLCKKSDAVLAEKFMQETYFDFFGYKPEIAYDFICD